MKLKKLSIVKAIQRKIRHRELIREFNDAVKNGRVLMYLQPQVDCDGNITGAEALARYRDRKGQIIYPEQFVDVLEHNGRIWQLDQYMWELAAQQLRFWQDTDKKDLHISVNVSPMDIEYLDVVHTLLNLVEKYQISPGKLNVEITETSFMKTPERYISLVNELHHYGFMIEIDDFGSGYSSLNLLKDIHADVLKLDMGFLQEENNTNVVRSRVIIDSVIEMAKRLHMFVISEGVETKEQAAYLSDNGCDLFQGFYFSRPVPVPEFESRLMC